MLPALGGFVGGAGGWEGGWLPGLGGEGWGCGEAAETGILLAGLAEETFPGAQWAEGGCCGRHTHCIARLCVDIDCGGGDVVLLKMEVPAMRASEFLADHFEAL